MVAKIKSGKSLIGVLEYSEKKVVAGKAELIGSSGYVGDYTQLTLRDKLLRLTDLAQRNLRTKTNTVHLSLNFHVDEKIDKETMNLISDEYMKRIGFGDQPYLIYEHYDAGHPHIHIVTTNIQSDGKRISLHYIGEKFSEPARKAIEIQFGLVKAEGNKLDQAQINIGSLIPVNYGKIDTKRAITNIVNAVTKSFKYTSLPELNAILNLYNITADRGSKASIMFNKSGLNYWILDHNGMKIGAPIKASSIYQKPTLKLLEGRFKLNEVLRKPLKYQLINKLHKAISVSNSLETFKVELKKENISLIVRQNAEGRIYGLSYVDQNAKVVFNGSDLGKAYSAASIIENLVKIVQPVTLITGKPVQQKPFQQSTFLQDNSTYSGNNLLDDLLTSQESNATHGDFGPQRKRKKKKKLNL